MRNTVSGDYFEYVHEIPGHLITGAGEMLIARHVYLDVTLDADDTGIKDAAESYIGKVFCVAAKAKFDYAIVHEYGKYCTVACYMWKSPKPIIHYEQGEGRKIHWAEILGTMVLSTN